MNIQKPIALDPGAGGLCIGSSSLRPADIIVSTTYAAVSGVIRVGTGSVVSHAALYVGNEAVIEAIGAGVVNRAIDVSLEDDALAVAYRVSKLPASTASAVIKFAAAQIGKSYNVGGALLSPNKIVCRIVGPRPAAFFCSQLVVESYSKAGWPLTKLPSQCTTPNDVVEIAAHKLTYVGHLKGNASWFPVISP